MFDISDRKKYFLLTKTLKRYANRIQNSVYEAYLKSAHIKGLIRDVENLMKSEKYFNSADKVRIYKLTGTCSSVIFGEFIEEELIVVSICLFSCNRLVFEERAIACSCCKYM